MVCADAVAVVVGGGCSDGARADVVSVGGRRREVCTPPPFSLLLLASSPPFLRLPGRFTPDRTGNNSLQAVDGCLRRCRQRGSRPVVLHSTPAALPGQTLPDRHSLQSDDAGWGNEWL